MSSNVARQFKLYGILEAGWMCAREEGYDVPRCRLNAAIRNWLDLFTQDATWIVQIDNWLGLIHIDDMREVLTCPSERLSSKVQMATMQARAVTDATITTPGGTVHFLSHYRAFVRLGNKDYGG